MDDAIAIVGLACRYPDAASPEELWENVLAQRQAFRRIPSERLSGADYYSQDPHAPDHTYSITAALIEDFEFDRVRFRVSGSAYRSADLAHWLALDVATRALADAGFPEGEGLPRTNTAVYLGNTLTGEFSRAHGMRLRWPYVRRVVAAALAARGYGPDERVDLLREIEAGYKRPFAEVNEETLAGGLSNTIAGRISNYFDLKGGAYTVDGACASSLLALCTACSALRARDCDVAIAGGVDLSLDPFEMVGFAKVGALAKDRMRVYDERAAGFWPGEGCGVAVLMRHRDALALACRIYGIVRGWGISSDGSGGLTRPTVEGQLLALARAYRNAGFGPDSAAYFEGHGTGTAIGDMTELRVIARARRDAGATEPAAIGSVKANVGHTKAAAGIAGFIKTALAIHRRVLPPTTGCETPHRDLGQELRVVHFPEAWPANSAVRAGVSAMGFGGINSHIVLEGVPAVPRNCLSPREEMLARTPQDAEIFLFASAEQASEVAAIASDLSLAELTDVAAELASRCSFHGRQRAAIVAGTPVELAEKLARVSFATIGHPPRVGFMFPGQGSQNASRATDAAQPAIVRESLQALTELRGLGIEASVAVGHSLGELTALCWAGALDDEAAVRLAAYRGRIMAAIEGPAGAMAAITADEHETRRLIGRDAVVIAGINSRRQTVISGEAGIVSHVLARAEEEGYRAALLPVSHAFHSHLVAEAEAPLAAWLAGQTFRAPQRQMVSTVTGAALAPGIDLRELLCRQITAPVRFREALEAAGDVDLWIEVGPGRVLSGLAGSTTKAPVFPLESGTSMRRPFLEAIAGAYDMGVPIRAPALFAGRFVRRFKRSRKFFVNPCEMAPRLDDASGLQPKEMPEAAAARCGASALEVIRQMLAERTELPESALHEDARLLSDLHLNSIVVAQIAAEAARRLGIPPPPAPLEYAGTTVAEMAEALAESGRRPREAKPEIPAGIDAWVRPFRLRLVPKPVREGPKVDLGIGEWRFFGPKENTLRGAMETEASLPPGGGVVLCLPPYPDEKQIPEMLEAAQAAVRLRPPARFVLVQHGVGASALARTVYLEARGLPVCVVNVDARDSRAPAVVGGRTAAPRHELHLF
jgi:enediyne polyketide synthase